MQLKKLYKCFKRKLCLSTVNFLCFIYFQVHCYHKEFYRSENLTLIVAGQVKPAEVFQALASVEDNIISKVL